MIDNLRYWLIKLLAGNKGIVMNVYVNGHAINGNYAVLGSGFTDAVFSNYRGLWESGNTYINANVIRRFEAK